jgi:nucleotide-binding universal stress UspA family protein
MGISGGLAPAGGEDASIISERAGFGVHEVVPIGAADLDAGGAVVVVGVDGSSASLHALRQAATVVKAVGGRIVVVYAWSFPIFVAEPLGPEVGLLFDAAEDVGHTAEADVLAVCNQAEVPASFIRCEGDPGRSIIDIAHQLDASCVVVGATIHGAIASLFLSSVAEYLLHHCDLSLVIVRPESAEEPSTS